MNRKTTHYISVLLTACVTLLAGGSCGDSLDADQTIERIQPDGNEGFTLEKAKSAFEAEYDGAVKVPMDETHFESPFVWESGDILPVWKLAERHEDVNTDYFSVPILTSRRYYATCESRNDADLIKCRQELLISRKASGKTTSRIVFHIPTDNTRPDDDRTHFTGLLVYTDLNGKFRKIERYENGTLVNGVYFGEKESAIAGERHFILVNQIMEGITVFKVGVPSVTLRSAPTDTVEINDTIAGSICIGDCSPDQWWLDSDDWYYNQDTGKWEFCPDSSYTGDYPWPEDNNSGGNGGGTPTNTGSSGAEHGSGNSNPSHDPNLPADYLKDIGTIDYYIKRHDDYCRRNNIKSKPEIYYISYGYKYCKKFDKLKKSGVLSSKGEEWVENTTNLLQKEMEALIRENPTIEDNLENLTTAAFKTQPKAYIEGGILQLEILDKIRIITTIEFKDIISKLGREQVAEVVNAQIGYYIKHPSEAVRDARYMKENWSEIQQILHDYVFKDNVTRSGQFDETEYPYYDFMELVFGEVICYFYETVDGFELND